MDRSGTYQIHSRIDDDDSVESSLCDGGTPCAPRPVEVRLRIELRRKGVLEAGDTHLGEVEDRLEGTVEVLLRP